MDTAFDFIRKLMIAHYDQDFVDDLVSDDPEIASEAAQEFCDALYTQGDIYPESLESVPHLVAALPKVPPRVQEQFLYTLGGIATGLNTPDSDPALIPQASVRVIEHWNDIAKYVTDPAEEVRLAALITLTDLARIQQMTFSHAPPAYAGALPPGVTATGLEERLRQTIDATRNAFDDAWQTNCDVALAYLSFAPASEFPKGDMHDYWSLLDRSHTF